MLKTKSQKIEDWTKKDFFLNVVVYVLNICIMSILFLLTIYMEGKTGNGKPLQEFLLNVASPLRFLTMLILICLVMVLYLFYEDKNFLKNPANSEMLFLIIEISLVACFASGKYVDTYLRPLAMVALLTLFLTDRRKAFFMNIIFCIIIFLFDSFTSNVETGRYPSLIMGFSSGVIATLCMDKVYSRLKLLLMTTGTDSRMIEFQGHSRHSGHCLFCQLYYIT